MKYLAIILVLSINVKAQKLPTLYFVHGQGSDSRIFDSLKFNSDYKKVYLKYDTLASQKDMQSFAVQLINQIDTNETFVLIGVSLGGMISSELLNHIKPEKCILIASAKCARELPIRYRIQNKVPVYKLFSGHTLKNGALNLQSKIEPESKRFKSTFDNMLINKSEDYYKNSVSMIMSWDKKDYQLGIYHIHGDNDHTIPLRNISNPYAVIKGGSHMITLTHHAEVSYYLNEILDK